MRLGAEGYFVKELQDDRDAAGSYLKFKELIARNVAKPIWRTLWKGLTRIRAMKSRVTPTTAGRDLYFAVWSDLHLAYYFLTSDETDPRLTLALASESAKKDDLLSQCAVRLGRSVERLVNELSGPQTAVLRAGGRAPNGAGRLVRRVQAGEGRLAGAR
jgi:hypothetical protein